DLRCLGKQVAQRAVPGSLACLVSYRLRLVGMLVHHGHSVLRVCTTHAGRGNGDTLSVEPAELLDDGTVGSTAKRCQCWLLRSRGIEARGQPGVVKDTNPRLGGASRLPELLGEWADP